MPCYWHIPFLPTPLSRDLRAHPTLINPKRLYLICIIRIDVSGESRKTQIFFVVRRNADQSPAFCFSLPDRLAGFYAGSLGQLVIAIYNVPRELDTEFKN